MVNAVTTLDFQMILVLPSDLRKSCKEGPRNFTSSRYDCVYVASIFLFVLKNNLPINLQRFMNFSGPLCDEV